MERKRGTEGKRERDKGENKHKKNDKHQVRSADRLQLREMLTKKGTSQRQKSERTERERDIKVQGLLRFLKQNFTLH